jgi:DNA-binding winged helix-turn-helix (wHTH) protein
VVVGFAGCELSVDRLELRRGGEVVAVEPQVFDVLAYLIRHRDRVVPKTELLDEIWGDRFVSSRR